MEADRGEVIIIASLVRRLSAGLACFALLSLATPTPSRAQSGGEAMDRDVVALSSLPFSFVEKFLKSKLSLAYEVRHQAVNPFYLTGDFDGDGQMDYVLRLVSKTDKDKEEDAVFFAEGEPRLLSRDIKEGYPGPAWYVVSKKGAPSESKGDAIMMVRPESSTAVVFWNGKQFEISWPGG